MRNRRKTTRYLLRRPVYCSERDERVGQIIDISAEGMQIIAQSTQKLSQTKNIQVDFYEPLGAFENEVECLWKVYNRELGVYFCGYRFLQPLDEDRLEEAVSHFENLRTA